MQIVDGTAWALRTAKFNLVSPHNEIEITLFPMIHVGEAQFFERVYADAFAHDIAFVEGIDSSITKRITRSYRWINVSKTLDLVVQPNYPHQADCHAKIIWADLSANEFSRLWETVPFSFRMLLYTVAPLMGLWMRLFGSRLKLAKNLTLEDLPRRDEILVFSLETAAMNSVLIEARDARLVEHVSEHIDNAQSTIRSISVVYGAQHMRTVLKELSNRYDYHIRSAEWLTVFTVK